MASTRLQLKQIDDGGATTTGQVISWNNSTANWEVSSAAVTTGTGTTNYLPKWTSATGFGLSKAFETSNTFSIGTNTGIDAYTRLYIYGGASGANVDARGLNSAGIDQATFDAQSSDYDTTFKSVHLRYFGPSAVGTTLGQSNVYLGDLTWSEPSTAIIQVVANTTPIRLGINAVEVGQISQHGLEVRTGKALRINDSDNTHYIAIQAPATGDLTTSYTLTLPQTDGASGEFLQTDGSGVLTWAAASGGGITALTGDVTGSGTGSVAVTLATVNSNVGTFGSATQVGVFTVNAKGLVTAASNTTIAIPSTAVTDFAEAVEDRVATLIQNGTGITWSYNDAGSTLTPTVTITQYTDEQAQDAVGAMVDSTLVYTDSTPLLSRAALTGDVTASAGSNATTIAANSVTLAKMADMATASFLGRNTAGTGDPEVLSIATAKTMLNLTGTNSGDQTITLTGDVTGSGTGSFAATIANSAVTYAKIQNVVNDDRFLGRISGANGVIEELTGTQATSLLDTFSTSATTKGVVPGSNGATTAFLRGDGTWTTPAVDGNGIYTGSGTIASNAVATLQTGSTFIIDYFGGNNAIQINDTSGFVNITSKNGDGILLAGDTGSQIGFSSNGLDVGASGSTLTGTFILADALALAGPLTPAQITSNQNNYSPTGLIDANVLRINSDAAREITGLANPGGTSGRYIKIVNTGAFNITLKNQSGSSTSSNRFLFVSGDIVLLPEMSVTLWQDLSTDRWRCVGISYAAPSGGGSGTVTHTSGALTSNSVVLGNGTDDVKVVAGIITDGTSKLTLGVAGTSVGSVDFKNATSGTITLAPTTGALGTTTLTMQATSGTIYSSGGTDVAVADGGTGLSSGTSGGILAYTASGTLASSAALTDNVLIVGGGAGVVPNSLGAGLGTTTQVLHGNASGEPTWGAINLATDVSGSLPLSALSNGTFVSALTGTLTNNSNFRINYNGGTIAFDLNDTFSSAAIYSEDNTQFIGVDNTNVLIGSGTSQMEYIDGVLRLYDSDATHYVGLQTPATGTLTTSYTLTLPADDGTAGQYLQTNGTGTLTWAAAGGGGLTWSVVTVDGSFTNDTGTIANKGTLLTMTLPASAAVGTTIKITGINAGLWKVAQNASQLIRFGQSTTTTGTGGSLEATKIGDSIEMICVVANTTWQVISSVGSITIV